jgi:ADP-ribosylglycohydrolase
MSWMGCLKGIAFGDAWGNHNEFLSVEEIALWGNPHPPEQFIITDDTQMTLYLADALEHPAPFEMRVFKIREKFVKWLNDPDNNRNPGDTCLQAIASLELYEVVDNYSKGNGSLMRVFPCAYSKKRQQFGLAKAQSELTHKHPTATMCCLLATYLLMRAEAGDLYAPDALGTAFRMSNDVRSPYYNQDISRVLGKALFYRDSPDLWENIDACSFIGDGWVAEEALALSLYFLGLRTGAVNRLGKAATCAGDSDTVAAITGGFIGAFYGDVWPKDWINRLEPRYKTWITKEWDIK